MKDKALAEYNEAKVKIMFWLEDSGEIGFHYETTTFGENKTEQHIQARKGLLGFKDKLQELIDRQHNLTSMQKPVE